jgi:membrane peptidoglycan carboxypeptidase
MSNDLKNQFPDTSPPQSPEYWSARRIRLNRTLVRKHIQHRAVSAPLSPRLSGFFLTIFILILLFVSAGSGVTYAYYQEQMPLLKNIAQHSLFQTTHIYDRNGHLLKVLYDQQIDRGRRTYVNYNDISPLLVDATVAAEDHTFWTNGGVDLYGIGRAAYSNLVSHNIVEGGSTITQQLIKKQLFPNQERTFQVKGEEAILATGLTNQYPKWKIMEMYLNTIYYGHLNYGVEAAAQDYFGIQPKCDMRSICKPAVSQLTLGQASLLAGLPQSPSYYDPTANKDGAIKRQSYVLGAMVGLDMITQKQADDAKKEMQQYTFKSYADAQQTQAPHFVNYVIDQLEQLFGPELADGGYNVYTTLDLDLQKKAEQIAYNHLYQPESDPYIGYYNSLAQDHNVNNSAAIVMNPKNGEILSMVGSVDFNDKRPTVDGNFNAALALRQPGSSFKPIVYATTFEMGWYPAMIVPDHQTTYPDQVANGYYTPRNYDGRFHTAVPMTVRTAIANSFNIPAVTALNYAGIPNVLNMAGRLGLSEVASQPLNTLGSSMALGSEDVSLLHLTSAYATFANRGVRVPPVSILEITDNQGHPIYKYDETHPHGTRAVRDDVAFLISSILSDKSARYQEFLPGNPLEQDFPAAAKTGTTDNFKDNWTLGYTPHLVVGVWSGNDDGALMKDVIGITGAGPIWHDIMAYATQRYHFPPDDFVRPPDVHAGSVSALTGLQPWPGEATTTDWFIDGTMPTITGSTYYNVAPPPQRWCWGYGCIPTTWSPRQGGWNPPRWGYYNYYTH